jgi:hypothetical protein
MTCIRQLIDRMASWCDRSNQAWHSLWTSMFDGKSGLKNVRRSVAHDHVSCYLMENIHSDTYSLLISTYIKDSVQDKFFFDAIEQPASNSTPLCTIPHIHYVHQTHLLPVRSRRVFVLLPMCKQLLKNIIVLWLRRSPKFWSTLALTAKTQLAVMRTGTLSGGTAWLISFSMDETRNHIVKLLNASKICSSGVLAEGARNWCSRSLSREPHLTTRSNLLKKLVTVSLRN